MIFKPHILAFTIILVAGTANAQTTQNPGTRGNDLGIIDTIIIAGNETTKDYVILDEMTLKPGARATVEAVEFDRNRIYSLGLFTNVEIYCDSLPGQRFLLVDVSERWYLIPVPVFGFTDGDPKRPYYGGGVLHYNFGGRNQKLFASIVFGDNPSLALRFSDPLISREHNLYFSGSLSYSRTRNRSKIAAAVAGDFDEFHYDINSTLGKRFSLYETAGINIGYRMVNVDRYLPARTVSPDGRDKYIYATLDYVHDSRDLREYALRGMFLSLSATKYGFGTSRVNHARIGADFRTYTPLPLDLAVVTRLHGTIVSGGFIPTYQRAYFGYTERIRGYFRTVFEGEDMVGGTVELRWFLMKPKVFNFTLIPLPREFTVWRFGIGMTAFADAGTVWFRSQGLRIRSVVSGYGGGFAFLLPYSTVVQTYYALNDKGKGQFILDIRFPL
jgi:outer membrane protein assembly factor BamA